MRSARAGFFVVAAIFIATLVAAPIAVFSMLYDLFELERVYSLTPADVQPATSYSRLRLEVVTIDEVARTATLRVSGHHICEGCNRQDKITFYSIPGAISGRRADGIPPSASITLPATSDSVTQQLQLPIHGDLVRYPFDAHPLRLGVAMQRLNADGTTQMLSPADAKGHLFLELRDQATRLVMAAPRELDPARAQPVNAHVDYLAVYALDFGRPLYLQIVVVLVTLLIGAAAAYAVLLRPFDQLILNSGALVLGVWGVRSLVLGSFPPNVTLVDAVLSLIIVFILCAISVRVLNHLHHLSDLKILPWARERQQEDEHTNSSPVKAA